MYITQAPSRDTFAERKLILNRGKQPYLRHLRHIAARCNNLLIQRFWRGTVLSLNIPLSLCAMRILTFHGTLVCFDANFHRVWSRYTSPPLARIYLILIRLIYTLDTSAQQSTVHPLLVLLQRAKLQVVLHVRMIAYPTSPRSPLPATSMRHAYLTKPAAVQVTKGNDLQDGQSRNHSVHHETVEQSNESHTTKEEV